MKLIDLRVHNFPEEIIEKMENKYNNGWDNRCSECFIY
jgi:hypothetical protein